MYHYTECGLPNIWLQNGVVHQETPYGQVTSIIDVEGLHHAIAMAIITHSQRLTGTQVRFLRKEMNLSQDKMAQILGVSDSSVRAWENHRTKIPKPVDRLLRTLYESSKNKGGDICRMLENLASLERKIHDQKNSFSHLGNEWKYSELVCA